MSDRPSYRSSLLRSFCSAVLAAVLIAVPTACDTSVETIRANDQYFSMFALLDPAADTQFVRVEDLRDGSLFGAPEELDATVTIQRVDDGGPPLDVTLTDSFATISGGFKSHLFWTDAPLEPGATYRVRAERSDGNASTAVVEMPSRTPTLELESQPLMPCVRAINEGVPNFIVLASAVDQLAGVYALYPIGKRFARRPHSNDVVLERDTFRITVPHVDDLVGIGGLENVLQTGGCPRRNRFDADSILVAAATAGPDWPAPQNIDSLTIGAVTRPDLVSNVTNGAGFIGGIYTDTLYAPIQWVPQN